MERLQKFIASSGYTSRRKAEELIKDGKVLVNGKIVKELGTKVSGKEEIIIDGELLKKEDKEYFLLNKPREVITSVSDDKNRKTVIDLIDANKRIYPIGRLDYDTTGVLLLTNDGDFAHRVISPKSEVEKLYYAKVDGVPDENDAAAFAEGIVLGDGTECLPAKLEPLGGGECLVTVMEGKYHQVKRMLASRGKPVLELRRLAVGGLALDAASEPGQWRELGEDDLCSVFLGRKQ